MKEWFWRFLIFMDICGFLCTMWAYIWNDWYAGWFAWYIPLTCILGYRYVSKRFSAN